MKTTHDSRNEISAVITAYADTDITSAADRSSIRISAFLAQVELLPDCQASDDFALGRRAIERLAFACAMADSSYMWTLGEAASVASFLSQVCAQPGACPMCEEGVPHVSAASGRLIVMTFMGEQLRAAAVREERRRSSPFGVSFVSKGEAAPATRVWG